MVFLSKIYTKTGDGGSTSLGDGRVVLKHHRRIDAYGAVDELNSHLGLLLAESPDFAERPLFMRIMNDLFDLGADLCVPQTEAEPAGSRLRVNVEQYERLERAIDRLNERLMPLHSFILPGGSKTSALCHVARTVARRAERAVSALTEQEPVNPNVLIYLNRLSDLLFVVARTANRNGDDDVLWKPGATNEST
jgi:cob(I)alamin adenosyltransferase